LVNLPVLSKSFKKNIDNFSKISDDKKIKRAKFNFYPISRIDDPGYLDILVDNKENSDIFEYFN